MIRPSLTATARLLISSFLAIGVTGTVTSCTREAPEKNGSISTSEQRKENFPDAGFEVTEDIENALFTWVDEDGSYQIAEHPADVPDYARKTVRVAKEGHSPGGPKHVYVVDLTELGKKKNLEVRAITRTEWEVLGKKERDEKIAALAPPEKPADPSPADLGVDAIVYGADWCKPCHMAEDYLKKKGARVIKKDIEEDPSAAAEMRRKLQSAGMGGSSIPVLDIGGTILRGFSEASVDSALARAAK